MGDEAGHSPLPGASVCPQPSYRLQSGAQASGEKDATDTAAPVRSVGRVTPAALPSPLLCCFLCGPRLSRLLRPQNQRCGAAKQEAEWILREDKMPAVRPPEVPPPALCPNRDAFPGPSVSGQASGVPCAGVNQGVQGDDEEFSHLSSTARLRSNAKGAGK